MTQSFPPRRSSDRGGREGTCDQGSCETGRDKEVGNTEVRNQQACSEQGGGEEACRREGREGEALTWPDRSTSPRIASPPKRRPSSTSSSPAWTRCARSTTSTTARPQRKKSGATARSCCIATEIGRASGRERVSQYVYISGVAVSLQKKKHITIISPTNKAR